MTFEPVTTIFIIALSFLFFLWLMISIKGLYVREKIFPFIFTKEQRALYKQVQTAIEDKQYEFKELHWIHVGNNESCHLDYEAVFTLPTGEILFSKENLRIKIKNGDFQLCPDLNSSHLILLVHNLGERILLDKEKSSYNQVDNSVIAAQTQLVGNQLKKDEVKKRMTKALN